MYNMDVGVCVQKRKSMMIMGNVYETKEEKKKL